MKSFGSLANRGFLCLSSARVEFDPVIEKRLTTKDTKEGRMLSGFNLRVLRALRGKWFSFFEKRSTTKNTKGTKRRKRFRLLALIALVVPWWVSAGVDFSESLLAAERVVSSQSCYSGPYESYESWVAARSGGESSGAEDFDRSGFEARYSPEAFASDRSNLECRFFRYRVDGYRVGGFVISPKEPGSHPVIIFNRGGSGAFGHVDFPFLVELPFELANAGFVVIGSQYRGGTDEPESVEGTDEWGGGDVDDVLALLDIVDSLDAYADPERIGMLGGSRGSVNMFMAARQSRRFSALVSRSGVYDLDHEEGFRPRMAQVWKDRMPDYADDRELALERRSVVDWVEDLDINAPILILHGAFDERASATGALRFATALQNEFRNYRLIMYERDDHFLSRNREDSNRQIIDWFEQHVGANTNNGG